MNKTKKSTAVRYSVLGALALAIGSLSLTGCNTTNSTPVNHCGDGNELCVPKSTLLDTGEVIFQTCAGCHGSEGEGGRGPNVRNADFLMADKERSIRIVLRGNRDSIRVNGVFYPGGEMPEWSSFSNVEIAGVLTYIRAVLNDSLVTNCTANPADEFDITCTKTARSATDIANDSVAVWEVKAVRDTLTPFPDI